MTPQNGSKWLKIIIGLNIKLNNFKGYLYCVTTKCANVDVGCTSQTSFMGENVYFVSFLISSEFFSRLLFQIFCDLLLSIDLLNYIIYLNSVYSYNIIDTFYFSIFKCIDCLNTDKFDTFNES